MRAGISTVSPKLARIAQNCAYAPARGDLTASLVGRGGEKIDRVISEWDWRMLHVNGHDGCLYMLSTTAQDRMQSRVLGQLTLGQDLNQHVIA